MHYSGSGRLGTAPDEILQQRRFTLGSDPSAGMLGDELMGGLPWGWLSGFESMTTASGQARAAMATVKVLQFAGAVILLIVIIGVIAFAVQQRADVLGKLGPTIAKYLDWLRKKLGSKVPDWARRARPSSKPTCARRFSSRDSAIHARRRRHRTTCVARCRSGWRSFPNRSMRSPSCMCGPSTATRRWWLPTATARWRRC